MFLFAAIVSSALGGFLLGLEIMDRQQTRREKHLVRERFGWIGGKPFILCECSFATTQDPVRLRVQQEVMGDYLRSGAAD